MRKIQVEVVATVTIEVADTAKLEDRDTTAHWEDLAWAAVMASRDDASRLDGWADLEYGQVTMDLQRDESLVVSDSKA